MRQFLYKILFAFSLGLILPQMVFAAQMSFDAKTTRTQIGEKFEVKLLVNAEQESINAFEGKIIFHRDILDLKEIRDGNSIVNFWIEKPKNQNGAIAFSGVTPGGFNGGKGLIFSAIFEAKKEGVAKLEINDVRVLRNDGTGSMATLTIMPFEVAISSGGSAEIPAIPKIRDREQPESFMPEIAKDATLFDGKWFIVFATQDKASGIDHYEIKESRQKFFAVFKKWTSAESPHVLRDQELRSFVFVKAVDKGGNERIIKITPRNPLAWYENYENWIMIIVGLLIIAFAARKLWKKTHLKFLILALLFIVGLAASPSITHAATLYFSPSSGSHAVGTTLSVSIYVSSADQAMNAASGVISFPRDKLEVISLSKTGSIFSLWVQKPSFSNALGTVNFEGIVLNPGFTGSSGEAITITFRTKAAGNAPLTFSSGSALANDGKGTNILTGLGDANFAIGVVGPGVPEIITPSEVAGAPEAPAINSPTHPDPNKWYASNSPKFIWEVLSDITGVRLLYDSLPTSVPVVFYPEPISEKQLENLEDGVWYFHAQLRNQFGWGGTSHFKFQIDAKNPSRYEIELVPREDLTERRVKFIFDASDKMSGISHYEIEIDDRAKETWVDDGSGIYTTPHLQPGTHILIARAVDKAGNFLTNSVMFTIEETPFFKYSDLIMTYLSIIIPILALIVLLLLLVWHLLRKYREHKQRMRKEIQEAEKSVHETFASLRTDAREQIKFLEKVKTTRRLSEEEDKIINQLKKDLDNAEKIISKEVEDIEKEEG